MFNIKTILLSIAGATMMGALTGCSFGWTTSYIYENGDKYTAGDREISEKIENIDLDYLSGDVIISESNSDKITITETSKKELSDLQRVHTWVDGGTLYIKCAASAKKLNLEAADNVNASVSSGNIAINTGSIKELTSKTSSGTSSYTLQNVPAISSLRASSGDITINLPKDADLNAEFDVSSGNV